MILFLFSGGVESTVLLKHFLKDTNQLIHVLYTKLGYDNLSKDRITEQTIAATNVLNYLKTNYRDFNYTSLELTLNDINRDTNQKLGFGFDEQWNLFFAAMYAKILNIHNIWLGEFSYCNIHSTKTRGYPAFWFHDGSLEKYALLGTCLDFNFYKNLKINFPSKNFNKTGIDSFNSKKEAFDYLEPELQKMIRSCVGKEKFCGTCSKCIQYKELGLINDLNKG
jgi:7-cyano-7-deazaguanine synthase in queuosine biosynthesis